MERITEDYCSFELSKLLKEKGFANGSDRSYTKKIASEINVEDGEEIDLDDDRDNTWEIDEVITTSGYIVNNGSGDYSNKVFYQCEKPTHALAIKWLREKFNLSVLVEIGIHEYSFIIFDVKKQVKTMINNSFNGSYEESTEKGIIEALNKLQI